MSEPWRRLNVLVDRVDRQGMIDLELQLVRENPSWLAVLQAYRTAQAELLATQAEAAGQSLQTEKSPAGNSTNDDRPDADASNVDTLPNAATSLDDEDSIDSNESPSTSKRASRWVQRLSKLQGIESVELSKIHGRLIAYDLLKCDLVGQSAGMVYQLTSSGKEVLARLCDEQLASAA